jgi:oxygen-independent coproporphyrinogen-3 oxidase
MQEYMGLGISAHSYMNDVRSANPSDMESYASFKEDRFPFKNQEMPQSRGDAIGDYFFTELRLIRGFALNDYKSRFGTDFLDEYKSASNKLFSEGFLEESNGYIRLSRKGLDYTNPVMEVLLNA